MTDEIKELQAYARDASLSGPDVDVTEMDSPRAGPAERASTSTTSSRPIAERASVLARHGGCRRRRDDARIVVRRMMDRRSNGRSR